MKSRNQIRLFTTTFLVAAASVVLAGCLGGPDDRAFITDDRYREARRAFERSSSVEVARMAMEQARWPRPMINEAVYRIEKEFGLKDDLPSPARIRGEEELLQEEQADRARASGFTKFSQLATQGLDNALQIER